LNFAPPPRVLALLVAAVSAFCVSAAQAQDVKIPLEIFSDGVFKMKGRTTPEQRAVAADPPIRTRSPAFLKGAEADADGHSNQLIIIPNFATAAAGNLLATATRSANNCKHSVDCGNDFVDLVNSGKGGELQRHLGEPVGARFVFDETRLSPAQYDAAVALDRASGEASSTTAALQNYIVLRYATVAAARIAFAQLYKLPDFLYFGVDMAMQSSAGWNWTGAANDPMLNVNNPSNPGTYQWGMLRMNMPGAWSQTRGSAYLGAVDFAVPLFSEQPWYFGNCNSASGATVASFHCDLADNLRPQFSVATSALNSIPDSANQSQHGTHVTGIMAARGDNSFGVSGACPWCSTAMGRAGGNVATISDSAQAMTSLVDRGMQAINLSKNLRAGGYTDFSQSTRYTTTCAKGDFSYVIQVQSQNITIVTAVGPMCAALSYAARRDVNVVVSAGNNLFTSLFDVQGINLPPSNYVPHFPAGEPGVISVAALQPDVNANGIGTLWNQNADIPPPDLPKNISASSAVASVDGVVAPGKNALSTFAWAGAELGTATYLQCGDTAASDQQGIFNDKFGTCTGTSMAAPHVTGLAGLIRSANPLLPASQVKGIVQNSGDRVGSRTNEMGYGVPNASNAVAAAIATNPSRLTPLFSFYSAARLDYFYTIAPQMGGAALRGTLRPGNESYMGAASGYATVGMTVNEYGQFPDIPWWQVIPAAQAWVFTTQLNPKNAGIPLSPLFRLSWKCGDAGAWTAACNTNPAHIDTAYASDTAGMNAFINVGYQLDGVEGYIYPKTMAQPLGTVRLMRKYNPTRDDHAIFPETVAIVNTMTSQGYTQNSGSDWLGYVYPNAGSRPTVQ
jgi:serine protease